MQIDIKTEAKYIHTNCGGECAHSNCKVIVGTIKPHTNSAAVIQQIRDRIIFLGNQMPEIKPVITDRLKELEKLLEEINSRMDK